MAISVKDRVMLWGRAGGCCSICEKDLVLDSSPKSGVALIGEAAHIIAKRKDGPRGKEKIMKSEVDSYQNLILLCASHHSEIDKLVKKYTVKELHRIKKSHEDRVRNTFKKFDKNKQRDDEIYADYVDEWAQRLSLDKWTNWVSRLIFSDLPQIHVDRESSLEELNQWLISRIWPKRYEELEEAFHNFRRVMQDLLYVFHNHSDNRGNWWFTEKFYHIPEWNHELYTMLHDTYIEHVKLVEDLALEMTRAANYICDMVRQYLDPSFRIKEGALLIHSGPYKDMDYRIHRPEYQDADRILQPYPGLKEFNSVRFKRDCYFGKKPKDK